MPLKKRPQLTEFKWNSNMDSIPFRVVYMCWLGTFAGLTRLIPVRMFHVGEFGTQRHQTNIVGPSLGFEHFK